MVTDKQIDALREAINNYTGCILDPNDLHDIARAYEKAAWLPISEAPRDGTEVLLVDQRTDTQVVAGWSGQPEPDDAPAFGWQTLDGLSYMTLTFTHFRPLPKGPSDE